MQSGPGFIPTFLYYFVGVTLIVALVADQGLSHAELGGLSNPFQIGIVFGLLAGGMGAYFNSHEKLELPVNNRGGFTKRLNDALKDLSYAEVGQFEEIAVYERSGASKVFSGKILVKIEGNNATIAGRAIKIRALKKKLQPSSPA